MASIMPAAAYALLVPRANLGMLVEGFDQLPRLGEICGREDLAGLAPGHDLARENERHREMRAHLIDIVQRG
jgi:hypothetical protein